jgi:hypothetical protein
MIRRGTKLTRIHTRGVKQRKGIFFFARKKDFAASSTNDIKRAIRSWLRVHQNIRKNWRKKMIAEKINKKKKNKKSAKHEKKGKN